MLKSIDRRLRDLETQRVTEEEIIIILYTDTDVDSPTFGLVSSGKRIRPRPLSYTNMPVPFDYREALYCDLEWDPPISPQEAERALTQLG